MKKIFTILCAVGLIATAKAQQPTNGGLNTWTSVANPDGWATFGSGLGFPQAYPLAVRDTADKIEGTSSAKLTTTDLSSLGAGVVAGYLRYGTITLVGSTPVSGKLPFAFRPDTLFFAYKYTPTTADTAYWQIELTKNGADLIAGGNTLAPSATWQSIYIVLTSLYANASTPDSIALEFSSSLNVPVAGSVLKIDAVRFGYVASAVPPTATVTPAGPINICSGSSQVLTAGTGTGYSYQWSNASGPIGGATSGTYTASATGTYTVKVTSTGGTATSNAVVVTQNPNPGVTVAVTQSNCATPTGTATATGTGGTGTLTYTWSPSGSGATLTGKPAGLYTVTVTDTKGCTATASKTITNPNAPTASLGSSTPPTCSYSTNGQATITASGGSGSGYTYTWNAGANTATRNDLAGGTAYTVTVKDGLSCAATATVNVNLTAPAALAPTQSNVNAVKCKGGNNGTATLSTTGGTPNYTYNWGGGTTGAAQTALTAKTYQVTVTDSKSCTATTSVVIGEPAAALSATTSKTNTTATALPVGGTSPYTYTWSTSPAQNTATATGLAKGTYTVTVKDANLCNTTATVTVLGPNSIETISAGITTLNVYPNPSNGVFNLEVSLKDASDLTISVSDIAGRKAFETTEKNVTDLTKQISLNNLSKGIYIVNIKTATGSANQRIVIE